MTGARPVCGHSTGSLTGCRPLCDRLATHVVSQPYSGSRVPIRSLRCAEHVQPTVNAAYPSDVTVTELPAGGAR